MNCEAEDEPLDDDWTDFRILLARVVAVFHSLSAFKFAISAGGLQVVLSTKEVEDQAGSISPS